MNKKIQIETFENFVAKQREILLSKGDDYANTDRLSNFKTAGQICGLTPAQHCLAMIATKIARLGVLLTPSANPAKNESIQDSVVDLGNYAALLNMILEEENGIPIENYPEPGPDPGTDPDLVCCGNWDEMGDCTCRGKAIDTENQTEKSFTVSKSF